jgi:hypothetical protein
MWVLSQGVSIRLGELRPYEAVRVAGLVDRLVIAPGEGVVTATLSDGTGTALAEWHLTRPTPQLAVMPGRAVVLEGVAFPAEDGRLALRDPAFHTYAFPADG